MNPTQPKTPYAIDYSGSGLDPKFAAGGNYAVKDGSYFNTATTPVSQPAAPVTSLSSGNGASVIDEATKSHQNDMLVMNNTPAKGNVNSGATAAAPTTSVTAEEAQKAGIDLTKYTYDPATKLYAPNTASATLAGSDTQYAADQKTINDAFATQVANMDSATAALMSSIQGIYSSRIADQQDANRRELATYNTANTRFGTSRYAPGVATSILTADERVGLDRIAKIANEEANLLAQANQSLQDKKYALFVQQRNELSAIRKERLDTLQKIKDAAYKAQQDKITNDLNAKIHDDTVSYQDKQLAISQATLDENKRKNLAEEAAKAADLKLKQDAANLISGAMMTPVQSVNGVVNAADQEKFLSTYTPQMQTLIKGVANYDIDPSSASKRAGAAISPVMLQTLAKAYNPDYKAGNFQAVNAFLKSWSASGNNSVVQSANTVIQHLSTLAEQADKLGNASAGALGPFTTAYNTTNQWLKEGAQSPEVAQFKQTALLVSSELAKIMKNGSGSNAAPTEEEIRSQLQIITANLSPQTAKAVIENSVDLMSARLNTARENYETVVGSSPKQILYPSAKAALEDLQRKGYNVNLSGVDPSPLSKISDNDLITGIVNPGAVSSTPSDYFNGLLDIINAPAPTGSTE